MKKVLVYIGFAVSLLLLVSSYWFWGMIVFAFAFPHLDKITKDITE